MGGIECLQRTTQRLNFDAINSKPFYVVEERVPQRPCKRLLDELFSRSLLKK